MRVATLLTILLGLLSEALSAQDVTERVPLVAVIANPAKYEGKKIAVIGFMHLEFEGNVLYTHREDYVHALLGNGIWVDVDQDKQSLSDSYVMAVGTFTANDKGHMGLWSGRLSKITTIKQWSTLQEPKGLPRPSPLKPKPAR